LHMFAGNRRYLTILITLIFLLPSTVPGVAKSTSRSAADQKLYEKAWATCTSSSYPPGTHPHINYSGRWFRCVEPDWIMR
jgi:hypothetical protein